MHDIRYDAIHDEFFVTNPFAQAILIFRGNANGEEKPIRVIQGPKTQMSGAGRLEVDPIHDEIFVPSGSRVLVYPRSANGDIAPLRILRGTLGTGRDGSGAAAVDPVHNILILGTNGTRQGNGSLLIYNRTDDNDTKPRGIIYGDKTGIERINQIQTYPPKGWIVATQPGRDDEQEPEGVFVGIWSINDSGNIPPRWKIGGPKSTIKKPRGVALNPKNKELVIADMRLNAVLTYYFPEIF